MDSVFTGCLAASKSVRAHYSCAKNACSCDSCCQIDAFLEGLVAVLQFKLVG